MVSTLMSELLCLVNSLKRILSRASVENKIDVFRDLRDQDVNYVKQITEYFSQKNFTGIAQARKVEAWIYFD